MGLKFEYTSLASTGTDLVLPFGSTTHLCEVAFSAMMGIKTKYWNILNWSLEPDCRITVSETIKLEFSDIEI